MIIDTFYEGFVAKLTSQNKILQISKILLSQQTNSERVLFVYKTLEDLNDFPSVLEMKKNNDISTHYRNLGNKCFLQTQYHKASQYYNLALLNATINSENYCTALSNRSAVFYELNCYKECLEDINIFFSLEYPDKLTEKLKKRKTMCNQALSKDKQESKTIDLDEIIKMKNEKGSRYLCASNKLEVVFTKDLGRHVIAKEDIGVGEIIVEEDPYLVVLLKAQYLFSCSHCLSRSLNLLPCDTCCFSLYCSKECKARAWKEYHEIECPLMGTLVAMDFTKLELLALRIVIRARHDHEDWNGLFKTIEDAEANIDTEFQGHVKIDDKWVYDSKYYASIHTLSTNIEKRSNSDIFQKSVTAAVFLRFLKFNTDFLKVGNENNFECVAGLLLLHLMTSPINMHGIISNLGSQDGTFEDTLNLASAPYAFCSLFNHSCAPNIVRFVKIGTARMSVFALRPIKKGMQIFDNYGPHHALENRTLRHQTLTFQYKFVCHCEACINDWPTYMELSIKPFKMVPAKLVKSKNKFLGLCIIEKLRSGDMATALKIYRRLCDFCQKFDSYAPCMELCDCQETLKQCLAIFEGLASYGSSLMVDWKLTYTQKIGNKLSTHKTNVISNK